MSIVLEREWLTLAEAASHFGISVWKISQAVRQHSLETKDDPMDRRRLMVQLADLQKVFERK